MITFRPERVVLRFSGPDAGKLLNDVITARMPSGEGEASWWALLSPQGKVQAEGLVGRAGDAFWLDVHREVAASLLKRMKMYRLRADVAIDDLAETHRVGWSSDSGPGLTHADGRGLGFRHIGTAEEAGGWTGDPDAPARARIAAGVCELGEDFPADAVFPHDLGMDLLGGVDFVKGCYVGQEVVSRMQHRGTARRRPVVVSGLGPAERGEAVLCDGREAGALGRVVDGRAVAILRLDRIEDPLRATVGGHQVALALPSWATYRFGESATAE